MAHRPIVKRPDSTDDPDPFERPVESAPDGMATPATGCPCVERPDSLDCHARIRSFLMFE